MTEKILVIDDNQLERQLLQDMLESAGHSVITISSGEKGLKLLGEKEGDFKLILLDLFMPKMSGQETLRSIRKMDRSLKVIIVSAYLTDVTTRVMLGLGALACLKKPIDRELLLKTVEEVLGTDMEKAN